MKKSEFNALVAATNIDPSSATALALRVHLVGGKQVAAAAKSVGGVSRQAVYAALSKLPRMRCPCCGQWMDRKTEARVKRKALRP